jgi:AcrR family transcriptional regulator
MPSATATQSSTADAILRTALSLFATKGFEGTALREIAESLGVTKAAIYYHFPSKDAVLLAIVEPLVADTDAILHRAQAEGWAPKRLLDQLLEVMVDHRDVVVALRGDIGAEARLRRLRAGGDQEERLVSLLAGPAPDLARLAGAVGAIGALRNGLIALGDRLPEAKPHLLKSAMGALGGEN